MRASTCPKITWPSYASSWPRWRSERPRPFPQETLTRRARACVCSARFCAATSSAGTSTSPSWPRASWTSRSTAERWMRRAGSSRLTPPPSTTCWPIWARRKNPSTLPGGRRLQPRPGCLTPRILAPRILAPRTAACAYGAAGAFANAATRARAALPPARAASIRSK